MGSLQESDGQLTIGNNDVENDHLEEKDVFKDVPNGGLQAWLQVVGAFFLLFNSWFVSP